MEDKAEEGAEILEHFEFQPENVSDMDRHQLVKLSKRPFRIAKCPLKSDAFAYQGKISLFCCSPLATGVLLVTILQLRGVFRLACGCFLCGNSPP